MPLRDFFASIFGDDEHEEEGQQDDSRLTFIQPDLPRDILVPEPEPVTWDDYEEARGKAYGEGGLVSDDGTPLYNEVSLAEIRRDAIAYGVFTSLTQGPPDEPQPWQERYISRGDGSVTDTTTGEIIERPEPYWEPVNVPEYQSPEPQERALFIYVESAETSEDGLSGEITLGYAEVAKESDVFWDIFGTSVQDDAADDDNDQDADVDDDGDSWRLF